MSTHPSKVLSYCSNCGSDKLLYEKDNSLLCKACKFRYYINSAAAVAIIILDSNSNILLTTRAIAPNKGMLDLPGGFVDIGESAEQAVVRELKEELNLTPKNIKYIGSYPNEYIYSGLTIYTLDLAYLCEVADFSGIKPADDVESFNFYSDKKLDLSLIAFRSIRNIIKDFIESKSLKI